MTYKGDIFNQKGCPICSSLDQRKAKNQGPDSRDESDMHRAFFETETDIVT